MKEQNTPRFQQQEVQNPQQSWFRAKFSEKLFRMKIINDFIMRAGKPEDRIEMNLIETYFPFLMFNSLLASYFFSRKCSTIVIIRRMILTSSYTALCVGLVGEKFQFFHALQKNNNPQSLYIRALYIKEYPDNIESQNFRTLNEKFIKANTFLMNES